MATASQTLDTRIMKRLKDLNTGEKKAVLSLVDNLVKSHDEEWSDEEKEELDELKRKHKTGKLKSFTVEEVRKHALKAIKK